MEDTAGTTALRDRQAASRRHRRLEASTPARSPRPAPPTPGGSPCVGGAPAAGTDVDFDMVSLLPAGHLQGPSNGMRKDLAEKIADAEPGFLRFPGGCLVNIGSHRAYDGAELAAQRVVPVEGHRSARSSSAPTNANFWGYNQSYGLGYYEYFQFAEDIGAEPLPVVPVGVNGCGAEPGRRRRPALLKRVHPGHARPDRVRQRPVDLRVGREARRSWATPSRSA